MSANEQKINDCSVLFRYLDDDGKERFNEAFLSNQELQSDDRDIPHKIAKMVKDLPKSDWRTFTKMVDPKPQSNDNSARDDNNIESAPNDNEKNQDQTDDTLDRTNAKMPIVCAIRFLEKAIFNLPKTEQYKPIFENLLMVCKSLNTQINSTIPFVHNPEIKNIPEKDEILVGGKITLKKSLYEKAKEKSDEPKNVVSKILRWCISDEVKKNSFAIGKQPICFNLAWNFGDKCLKGEKRVEDGQTNLDMIIELAHIEKHQQMTKDSKEACEFFALKACDDCRRDRGDEEKKNNEHKRSGSDLANVSSAKVKFKQRAINKKCRKS